MAQFHVIATGTSILQNFSRTENEIVKKYRMEDWARLSPEDPKQKKIEAYIPRGNEVHESLLSFVKKDPKKASAELNAFLNFVEKYGQRDIEILIYCTDTNNNRLTAQIIYEYLKEEGYKLTGEPVIIKNLGRSISQFEEGLVNLLDQVIKVVKSKSDQGYEICINATAGYKPETAFLVLASSLVSKLSPTVYYIHEAFQEVITLPTIPVKIEDKYIEIAKKFMEPQPQNYAVDLLKRYGFKIEELVNQYILTIDTDKNLVQTRKWLRKLIEIYEK